VVRVPTHIPTALAALARRVQGHDHERGDVSGWASLAGLATVGTVTMMARYHELLVQVMVQALDTPLDGLPGV
jgi:hypothetical protein